MRRIIAALGLAFCTSVLLYKPTHARDIPELARYGTGGFLLLAVGWLLYGDAALTERMIVILALSGSGVAANRLRMALGL